MAYIGQSPSIGNFQVCDAISVVNGQAAYTMQVSSVNVVPETANHMIVTLNGVIQTPGSSYTVSGSTITFASNLATGDVINFIHILGSVLDLGVPSDDTVSTAKISANAVTAAKFNADVISGQTALASEPADTDEFLVSDAGVLKRIDYSLIKGGGMHTLLSTTTVSSAVSSVDIEANIDTTYNRYLIRLDVVRPATDNAHLYMRIGSASGYITSSTYDYTAISMKHDNSSLAYTNQQNVDHVRLADEVDTASTGRLYSDVTLYNITSTSIDPQWQTNTQYMRDDIISQTLMNGRLDGQASVNFSKVRFYFHSGNVDAGTFKLYGIT